MLSTKTLWSVILVSAVAALAFNACSSTDSASVAAQGGSAGAVGEGGSAGDAGLKDGSLPDGSVLDADASGEPDATEEVDGSPGQDVARGEYLVKHVAACGDCHTPRNQDGSPDLTKWLAGNPSFAQIPGLGPDGGVVTLATPNLTPDKTTGLGDWSDAQIKKAFTEGLDDEGKALFPVMPYYVFHNISPADQQAIVDYLRSIPAVSHAIPERSFDVPMPVPPMEASKIPEPELLPSDPGYASAVRGKYLAGNVGVCMECHTKHVSTPGAMPLDTSALFAGGEPFYSAALGLPPMFPPIIYSQNITPDQTGLIAWTVDDIVAALKEGKDKDGKPLCPPMPAGPQGAFGGLTNDDAKDIANYIHALPPKANDVPKCEMGDGGMMQDSGMDGSMMQD
jgi:mono/diheme cytochrome c family protein